LKNNFKDKIGSAINSLNLTKIYILTTKVLHQQVSLINGLKSYMEVVQIGDVTTGKMLGQSLYTTPHFWNRKQKPNHRYAMPIVLKSSMQTVSEIISTD
jgi:hypothetical protein